jgi:hypothetical protein
MQRTMPHRRSRVPVIAMLRSNYIKLCNLLQSSMYFIPLGYIMTIYLCYIAWLEHQLLSIYVSGSFHVSRTPLLLDVTPHARISVAPTTKVAAFTIRRGDTVHFGGSSAAPGTLKQDMFPCNDSVIKRVSSVGWKALKGYWRIDIGIREGHTPQQ